MVFCKGSHESSHFYLFYLYSHNRDRDRTAIIHSESQTPLPFPGTSLVPAGTTRALHSPNPTFPYPSFWQSPVIKTVSPSFKNFLVSSPP